MEFSYNELNNYGEIFNAVKAHADDVKYYMAGAYPDSSAQFDIDLAIRNAQLLAANAQALVTELTVLKFSREGVR
jgi:hypothetical protein